MNIIQGRPLYYKCRGRAGELILLTTEITRREIDANILETAAEIKSLVTKIVSKGASLVQPDDTLFGMPFQNVTTENLANTLRAQVNAFFAKCDRQRQLFFTISDN